MSQERYLVDLLKKFQMIDYKAVLTLIKIKLYHEKDSMDSNKFHGPYRRLHGCLMYAMIGITLDLHRLLASLENFNQISKKFIGHIYRVFCVISK